MRGKTLMVLLVGGMIIVSGSIWASAQQVRPEVKSADVAKLFSLDEKSSDSETGRASTIRTSESGETVVSVSAGMLRQLLERLNALERENEELRERVEKLEKNSSMRSGESTLSTAVAASSAGSEVREKSASASPQGLANQIEEQFKKFQFFGEIGFRWHALLHDQPSVVGHLPPGAPSLKGFVPFFNAPELRLKLGIRGNITDRLGYELRLSSGGSGVSNSAWTPMADAVFKRGVRLDHLFITHHAYRGENYNNIVFAGKATNPLGLETGLVLSEDLGASAIADIGMFRVRKGTLKLVPFWIIISNTSLFTGVDDGKKARRLVPPTEIPSLPGIDAGGLVNEISVIGSPRTNGLGLQFGGNFTAGKTNVKFDLTYVNFLNIDDAALAIGATGLGVNGVRLFSFPDGINTNLPKILPVDRHGVADLSSGLYSLFLAGTGYSEKYRLLNIFGKVGLRSDQRWPVSFFGDWVRNLGASNRLIQLNVETGVAMPTDIGARRDGYILGFQIGEAAKSRVDVGYRFIAIASNATLDFVNSEELATNIRGHQVRFNYQVNKNVTQFVHLLVSKDYDPRLPGLSDLATYDGHSLRRAGFPDLTQPNSFGFNQLPGTNPTVFRLRAGFLFRF
jgi:hypothetical protein